MTNNPILTAIAEQGVKLENLYLGENGILVDNPHERFPEVQSFNRSSQLSTLKVLLQEVEGMKKDTSVKDFGAGVAVPGCATCHGQEDCQCGSFNEALSSVAALIKDVISELEK